MNMHLRPASHAQLVAQYLRWARTLLNEGELAHACDFMNHAIRHVNRLPSAMKARHRGRIFGLMNKMRRRRDAKMMEAGHA